MATQRSTVVLCQRALPPSFPDAHPPPPRRASMCLPSPLLGTSRSHEDVSESQQPYCEIHERYASNPHPTRGVAGALLHRMLTMDSSLAPPHTQLHTQGFDTMKKTIIFSATACVPAPSFPSPRLFARSLSVACTSERPLAASSHTESAR